MGTPRRGDNDHGNSAPGREIEDVRRDYLAAEVERQLHDAAVLASGEGEFVGALTSRAIKYWVASSSSAVSGTDGGNLSSDYIELLIGTRLRTSRPGAAWSRPRRDLFRSRTRPVRSKGTVDERRGGKTIPRGIEIGVGWPSTFSLMMADRGHFDRPG